MGQGRIFLRQVPETHSKPQEQASLPLQKSQPFPSEQTDEQTSLFVYKEAPQIPPSHFQNQKKCALRASINIQTRKLRIWKNPKEILRTRVKTQTRTIRPICQINYQSQELRRNLR